jgi:hypothetical protein
MVSTKNWRHAFLLSCCQSCLSPFSKLPRLSFDRSLVDPKLVKAFGFAFPFPSQPDKGHYSQICLSHSTHPFYRSFLLLSPQYSSASRVAALQQKWRPIAGRSAFLPIPKLSLFSILVPMRFPSPRINHPCPHLITLARLLFQICPQH